MINYLEEVERNYSTLIKAITNANDNSDSRLAAILAEYATGDKMDYSSVVCISKNEVAEHVIRTYAMKRMDGNVFIITFESGPKNWWSLQSGIINISTPTSSDSWGDAANYF